MADKNQDIPTEDSKSKSNADPSVETQHVAQEAAQVLQSRSISRLSILPWVIELRVVGTTNTINISVSDSTTVLGRASQKSGIQPDIDLSHYDAFAKGVSRNHLSIAATPDYPVVQDLNSANGSYLNDKRLPSNTQFPLQDGDELRLGNLRLQVRFNVMPSAIHQTRRFIGRGRHILVVEDDMDVAYAYRMMLENSRYRVSVIDDPAKLLLFLTNSNPDAVICDLALSSDLHTNIDIVHVLKKELKSTVPIIVVSGMTAGHRKQQAMDSGADEFIGKPVRLDYLIKRVNELIEAKQNSN